MPSAEISTRFALLCRRVPASICLFLLAAPLMAVEERFVDRPPFDQLILDEANKSAILNVEPLELPDAKCRLSHRA